MALPLSPGRSTSQADMALRLTDSNSPSPKRAASPQFDGGTPQKLVGSGKLPPSPSPHHRRRSGTVRAPFAPHGTPRAARRHVDLSDTRAPPTASVVPQSASPKVIKRPWQKEVRSSLTANQPTNSADICSVSPFLCRRTMLCGGWWNCTARGNGRS